MLLSKRVDDLFIRRKKIDEDFYEELEEILIGADVGVNTVLELIDEFRAEVRKRKIEDPTDLQPILSEKLIELLKGMPMQVNIKERLNCYSCSSVLMVLVKQQRLASWPTCLNIKVKKC